MLYVFLQVLLIFWLLYALYLDLFLFDNKESLYNFIIKLICAFYNWHIFKLIIFYSYYYTI